MTGAEPAAEESGSPAVRLPWRGGPPSGDRQSSSRLLRRASRAAAKPGRLREWHNLPDREQETEWERLRAWVTWPHDRYELGLEERLPPCWAEHPGLIEELRALKAWREEIYTSREPSGQAARYWHAEMRQTITAALTFYAAGCRAGHRSATSLAARSPALQRRWSEADPAAGIPACLLTPGAMPPAADGSNFRGDAAMRREIAAGGASPLSRTIRDCLRYDGSWWLPAPGGWLRVTDPQLAAALDRRAATMAEADARVGKAAARRPAKTGS